MSDGPCVSWAEVEWCAAAKMIEMGLRPGRIMRPTSRLAGNRHERRKAAALRRRATRRAR